VPYFNGSTISGTTASTIDLSVSIELTSPFDTSQDFTYNLTFNMTPNSGTAQQNADYLYLPTEQTLDVFLYNNVSYTLEFLGFGSLDNNGFVTSVDQFHVLEGESSSAQLFGKFTASTLVSSTPEPTTMLLLGFGLLGIAGISRKKTA